MPHGALFTKTRARKKKTLTEPIDLLPFPEQSLREKKKDQKIKTPVKKETVEKPISIPKIKTSKKSNIGVKHLSIKEILQNEREEKNKKEDVLPREKVNIQKALVLWRQYAFRVKDQGMETFYNALVKRDPLFETNEKIKISVDNQIQIDYINPLLGELINFLREQLKNHFIEIELELTDNPDEEVKFLNGNDKFEALSKKNPKLITLKNLFNLDIEF